MGTSLSATSPSRHDEASVVRAFRGGGGGVHLCVCRAAPGLHTSDDNPNVDSLMCAQDGNELHAALKDRVPAKIDIGPVYNVDPAKRAAYSGESERRCSV